MDSTATSFGNALTTTQEENKEEHTGGVAGRQSTSLCSSAIEGRHHAVNDDDEWQHQQIRTTNQPTTTSAGTDSCPATTSTVVYTIGIAGGSGAGKTTLAKKIYEALGGADHVCYLVHDAYYKDQSDKCYEDRCQTNFDHPDALETDLMLSHIQALKAGRTVAVPVYDFATHTRQANEWTIVSPKPILLLEGILLLHEESLVREMDLKVFVDAEADVRFIRRLLRDCAQRGRTMDQVVQQYHATVRPMHNRYVAPSGKNGVANLVVHADADGTDTFDIACAVLTNHLRSVVVDVVAKAHNVTSDSNARTLHDRRCQLLPVVTAAATVTVARQSIDNGNIKDVDEDGKLSNVEL